MSKHTYLSRSRQLLTATVALSVSLLTVAPVTLDRAEAAPNVTSDKIGLYLSAPLVQGSHVSGANTSVENFNNFAETDNCTAITTTAVATMSYSASNACQVKPVSPYGGAASELSTPAVGGTGTNWMGVPFYNTGSERSITFTFPAAVKYVGLWWSGGNNGNLVRFYDSSNRLVAEITSNDIVSVLGANPPSPYPGDATVPTVGGSTHKKGYYFGNPIGHTNPPTAESTTTYSPPYIYTYLNLFITGDLGITKMQVAGPGFEFDNVTVSTVEKEVQNDMVKITEKVVPNITWAPDTDLLLAESPATPSSLATSSEAGTISYSVVNAGNTGCSVNSSTGVLTYTANGSCVVRASFTPSNSSTSFAATKVVTFSITGTISYNATWDSNGGSAVAGSTFISGGSVSKPADPSKSGKFFGGWATSETNDQGNVDSRIQSWPYSPGVTSDVTLYAIWLDACLTTENTFTGSGTNDIASSTYGQAGEPIMELRFTSITECAWVAPANVTSIDLAMVGGGGAGGYGSRAGGGGAGELLYSPTSISVQPGKVYLVRVGQGGYDTIAPINNSGIAGKSTVFESFNALGGGAGVGNDSANRAGGSGGGAANCGVGTTTIGLSLSTNRYSELTELGNSGGVAHSVSCQGNGGGGGGAGSAGVAGAATVPGNGGSAFTVFGVTLAGGGGAWGHNQVSSLGGGANGVIVGGSFNSAGRSIDGAANTGSGGSSSNVTGAGAGADGLVIIRYQLARSEPEPVSSARPYEGPLNLRHQADTLCLGGEAIVTGERLNTITEVYVGDKKVEHKVLADGRLTYSLKGITAGSHQVRFWAPINNVNLTDQIKAGTCSNVSATNSPVTTQGAFSVSKLFANYRGDRGPVIARDRAAITAFINQYKGITSVKCVGSTSGVPAKRTDPALAQARAKNACDIVKTLVPNATFTLETSTGKGIGQRFRSVTIFISGTN